VQAYEVECAGGKLHHYLKGTAIQMNTVIETMGMLK
jgi:hypothetical protein